MEQLHRAETSSDLGENHEGLGDVDWLRAAGAVGQRFPLALATWRLVGSRDLSSVREAVNHCVVWLSKRGQGKSSSGLLETTGTVLAWMFDPVCHPCGGLGFEKIPGTTTLSETPCSVCHGEGKRARNFSSAGHDLYEHILDQQRQAAQAINQKLRG